MPGNDEIKCNTTCYFHDTHEKTFARHEAILNGEHGNVGLVGKVDTLSTKIDNVHDVLDRLEGRFWKLTLLMLGALGLAALNLFLLLAKGWGK